MTKTQERTFKKACFFQRVSTNSQDVEMQVQAAARFRENYLEEDIIDINEHGVSSNKLSMKQRKHLLSLIEMIKTGEIHTLYVYDRSRLTRRFYEYFYLYSLLWENNVQVVFTTTDSSYPPFSRDTVTEGINALLTEEEGKNISRRTLDTHKKTPNQKFGYITAKNGERRTYVHNYEFQLAINTYFEKLKNVLNLNELASAALELKKVSKRPLKMIFSMALDAFYCAHEQSNNKLYPLPYVTPYLSVEEFKENVKKLSPMLTQLDLHETELQVQNIFNIKCGSCGNWLKYDIDAVNNEAYYYCNCGSNKKQTVRYTISEIREVVAQTVIQYFKHINLNYLRDLTIKKLSKLRDTLSLHKLDRLSVLKQKELSFSLENFRRMHPDSIQVKIDEINKIKKEYVKIETDVNLCSFTATSIHDHIHIIQEQLYSGFSKDELIQFAPSIIDEIIAYHDKIDVIQFFTEGCTPQETFEILEVNDSWN
ncbi:recombinase family protein [Niallia sp. MER TA 168]|uniref:recombinase family protein n=1 Tax=Niallia sp. MER TA 168 TaxID=2939568 RepID=UPI00203FECA4|nr:recombinase family protein [Niallia sp. MER TA 168]MCM3362244.1 recombinase family protein [Niallia sp. MER TA 168]